MTWLTEKQLAELTRRTQPAAQIRVLQEAGIPHRVVDGRAIVLERDLAPAGGIRDNDRPQLRLTRRRA